MLDHADHHLLHLLCRFGTDDLTDDAWCHRVAGPVAIDDLVDDVRPHQVAAGGNHVDGGQHLDRGRIDALAKRGGGQLNRLPLAEIT